MVELASTVLGGLADKGVGQRGKEGSGPSFFYWINEKLHSYSLGTVFLVSCIKTNKIKDCVSVLDCVQGPLSPL